jgi:uncharacterized protein
MIINVARIRKDFGSSEEFNLDVEIKSLDVSGEAVEFTRPVDVQVRATNLGTAILLQGRIQTEVKLTCSRCLESFHLGVDTEFAEEMVHVSDVPAYIADHPESEEEENYSVYSADELELTPRIIEHLVLALPMKPLCFEECKGLCPKCGRNLNLDGQCNCDLRQVDPRLAGLAKLLSKE